MPRPKAVRSLSRGIAVLEALNRLGTSSALTIARETKIPRPTVYRLLSTLQSEGYVGRSDSQDLFHLRLKVRQLSDGFDNEQWIVNVARPAMATLTKEISWPCDVLALRDLNMVVLETTHPTSPFSIDKNMIGRALPLLGSASGLAYLAFAPEQESAMLLDMLARSEDPDDRPAAWRRRIDDLVADTRRRGFAVRQGGRVWPHTGSVALPLRRDGRVFGCISVIWMARVLTEQKGIADCLGPLLKARDVIEKELSAALD